jgi:hypothetical protein
MSRVLLMAYQNVPEPVFMAVQFIVNKQDRAARVAENGINALLNKRLD